MDFAPALLAPKALIAAALGVASHQLYFIRGEHHLQAPKLTWLAILAPIVVFWVESGHGVRHALLHSTGTVSSYYIGLFGSIIAYRALFHPLRAFPGPPLAKTSKLWHVFNILDSKNHLFLDDLHARYGDIVRTGPSELTVFRPEIYNIIGGPGTACIKAPWYDMIWPYVALTSIREKKTYASRRRLWDEAFKSRNLEVRDDKALIIGHVSKLADQLGKFGPSPVNVLQWFNFLSFDLMGDFAFGKSFNLIESGQWTSGVKLIQEGIDILGIISPVPWLAQVAFSIPGAAEKWNRLIDWCKSTMGERLATDVSKPDVTYWLVEARRNQEQYNINMNDIYGDAVAMIIAGSHTTASTLTMIFYHLSIQPHIQAKLRAELGRIPSVHDYNALKDMAYLDAVINETLRLHPVLLTAGNRLTGHHGILVGKTYIPPETTIVAPRYTIARLESCFERATEFIPERWVEKPEMIKDKRAFNPFNLGRHSCPGKNVGLMELRLATAILVSKFEVLPAGDGRKVIEDTRDNFAAQPGNLNLIFRGLD